MNDWQIWIDTGGTFTDCIAIAPNGEKKRIKVLSSGKLRGVLLEKQSARCFKIQHSWQIEQDILQGYDFQLLGTKNNPVKVEKFDPIHSLLYLTSDIDFTNGYFEITANEEAPILATRIATQTPLGKEMPKMEMRLGSTKGTNALLERKGAKVTLLITEGYRDLLYIGTQQRPHLFQLDIPEPHLLYEEVIEVKERLDANGNILVPLTVDEINKIVSAVKTESVAIALLHSYLNPFHEQQLAQALAKKGVAYISLSSALSPSIKILPRTTTALVNAYLHPILENYLQKIKQKLNPNTNLRVMTSSGGLVSTSFFQPKDSLLSGPAGGVVGAASIATQLGFSQILTLDMGGTSTDTARFSGNYDYNFTTKVGDALIFTPSLAIETVAAGGGSICAFDGKKLTVGPESAGAEPGPACYGAGGPLTITDVNLLLGKLDASAMGIPIDAHAAEQQLLNLQQQIHTTQQEDITLLELLTGLEQIANEKMAEAIRRISVAKGFDPQAYALLAFGGAGGLHACKIADLLQIQHIILPFDSGLLSAYGIGMAQVQRIVSKQILQPYKKCQLDLPDLISNCFREVTQQLEKEGIDYQNIEQLTPLLYLRFVGQDTALEVPYSLDLVASFKLKYEQLFGHYPENAVLEVESIKVIAQSKSQQSNYNHTSLEEVEVLPNHFFKPSLFPEQNIPVYYWEKMPIGSTVKGKAILLNATSTTFIEEDWQIQISKDKNAILTKIITAKQQLTNLNESIELELFTNRFKAIAEEMGAQLQRTAFSVNIKERLDFSCALLDANAHLLVNAPHIPVHLGSLGVCARLILEKFPLQQGDVIITNHPKYGGSHLPDLTMLSAVFSADNQLIGYVINRAHHAEIGGNRPGSMPPNATRLVEEGVAILPTYLVKSGVVQWQSIQHILQNAPYPTRAIQENLADINAALASLRTGAEKLQQLVHQQGLPKVHYYMQLLKDSAKEALAKAMENRIGKTFQAQETLDDGHLIEVDIQFTENKILFDFSDTSAVHPRNLNANISIVFSAVLYVLRLLCNKDIPLNEGLMEQVELKLPNSFLHPNFVDNPEHCPAVVGGNTEVSQRLVDTLLKALDLSACSQGTMNNFLFGNSHFGYYETIGGGVGAGNGFHGRSAIHQHMTNTKITDAEELERRYPVRLHCFAIRHNSGGVGKWNGGNGIIRAIEFLEEVEMTLLTQHRSVAPYGKAGGADGKVGTQILIRKDGTVEKLNGMDSRSCKAGDCLIIETPGGGAWGKNEDVQPQHLLNPT